MILWIVCCCELMKCLIARFGLCCWTVARENNCEHWFSCPNKRVSPKRD